MIFQSTLPRGERLSKRISPPHLLIFQSTLPRGERHDLITISDTPHPISIHAPARGATRQKRELLQYFPISIHAPARGATSQPRSRRLLLRFQSTLPRGERRSVIPPTLHIVIFQSTLPRGERRSSVQSYWLSLFHFNPRSREGSDDFGYGNGYVYVKISIHAPARGATLSLRNIKEPNYDFNPRSREGSDEYP